jgi:ureidoacrylate peracid hydrolase
VKSSEIAGGRLADWIAPHRTALLIVDMQADFGAPDGSVGRSGADMSAVTAALAGAERLAEGARAAGAPVIFVALQTSPEQDSRAWAERLRRIGGEPALELDLCRAGTPGAAFVGPKPEAGELVVPKLRYSGFFRTSLDAELRGRGVDTLVACGLTTDCSSTRPSATPSTWITRSSSPATPAPPTTRCCTLRR